ncbi:MAG: hypothetical protein N2115_02465 [bacterium]|nr:hypothetical protein [bacterium]
MRTKCLLFILVGLFSCFTNNTFGQKEALIFEKDFRIIKGKCTLEHSILKANENVVVVSSKELPQKCYFSFEIKTGTKTSRQKPFLMSFSQTQDKEDNNFKISIWAKSDTIWIDKIFPDEKETMEYKVRIPEKTLNDRLASLEKTKEDKLAQWQEWGLGIMGASFDIRALNGLKELIEENKELPSGEEKWTKIAVEKDMSKITISVDGRYICTKSIERNNFLILQVPQEGVLRNFIMSTKVAPDKFVCCDLSGYFNHKIDFTGDFSKESGLIDFKNIPFLNSPCEGKNILYVGKSRPMEAGFDYGGLGDTYHLASGMVNNPSRIVLRIPKAWYKNIYILGFALREEDTQPVVSFRFINYTTTDMAATIPFFDGKSDSVLATPVKDITINGKKGSIFLVKIPVPICLLQNYLEEEDYRFLEIEITKKLDFTRGYPDPWCYNILPVGKKSSVYILGLTLEKSDVEMAVKCGETGNVFVAPEKPVIDVILRNRDRNAKNLAIELKLKDYYGRLYTYKKSVKINPEKQEIVQFSPVLEKYGFYTVEISMNGRETSLQKQTTLMYLPEDDRIANVKDSLFGLWSWGAGKNAGRYTPFNYQYPKDREIPYKIAKKLGARWLLSTDPELAKKYQLAPSWRFLRGFDPVGELQKAKIPEEKWEEQLKINILEYLKKQLADFPTQDVFLLFGEANISAKHTFGLPPEYYGEPEYQLDEKEKEKFDKLWKQAILVGKAFKEIKAQYPEFSHLLLAFGNTSPSFHIEFMKKGYPYFDAFGIDIPFFERMPERQPRAVELSQLLYLKDARKKYNLESVPIIGTEYMYYPGCPGSLTQQQQADYYVRAHLLSFALGMERCSSVAMIFSAAGPYGRCHYGASGLFEVSPYGGGDGNPRIAAVSYATMTKILDGARFVRWYPTGSFSSFCLLFDRKFGKGPVFALWTIKGERTINIMLKKEAKAKLTDSMGNFTEIKTQNRILSFKINSSPVWLEGIQPDDIETINAGIPVYPEKPDKTSILIEDFSKNTWTLKTERDQGFEENNFDLPRFPGLMKSGVIDTEMGKALRIKLERQEKERKLAPFYSNLIPEKPIVIKGEPRFIGLWVKGNSGWSRIIPQFIDAKGEVWTFIGPKDEWNSDDIHSWSSVNFDGWKYMEIELPYTYPSGVVGPANSFWKCEKGDGVVDFPLTLIKFFIEQRNHIWYVNEILPVENPEIIVGKIYISYRDPYPDLKLTKNW